MEKVTTIRSDQLKAIRIKCAKCRSVVELPLGERFTLKIDACPCCRDAQFVHRSNNPFQDLGAALWEFTGYKSLYAVELVVEE